MRRNPHLESSRASGLCGRGPSLFFLLLLRDDAAALPPPSLLVGLVLGILFWYYSALFILVLISPPLLVAVCGAGGGVAGGRARAAGLNRFPGGRPGPARGPARGDRHRRVARGPQAPSQPSDRDPMAGTPTWTRAIGRVVGTRDRERGGRLALRARGSAHTAGRAGRVGPCCQWREGWVGAEATSARARARGSRDVGPWVNPWSHVSVA